MKLIIVANVNTKLFSWMFIFRKVMRQHTWGEVLVLIQASSVEPFWTNSEEIMKIDPLLPKSSKNDLLFYVYCFNPASWKWQNLWCTSRELSVQI